VAHWTAEEKYGLFAVHDGLKVNMKKTISSSFLLFIVAAVLSHVLILHHHHKNSSVCFLTVNCEDSEETQQHFHDSDCYQCKDNCNMEKCPLEEVYRRLDSHKPVIETSLNKCVQHPIPADLTAETAGLEYLSFRLEPYPPPCHTGYISDSFGLRAPPTLV